MNRHSDIHIYSTRRFQEWVLYVSLANKSPSLEYIGKHNPQDTNHSLVECRLVKNEISRASEYKCPRAFQCLLHIFLDVTRVKFIEYCFDFRSGALEDLGQIRVLTIVFTLEFVSELGLNLEFSVVDAVQSNLRRPRGGDIAIP